MNVAKENRLSEKIYIEHKFGKLSATEQQWLDRVNYFIAEINYKIGLRLEISDSDILEAISKENLANYLHDLLEPYIVGNPEILTVIDEASKYGIELKSFEWGEHDINSRLLTSELVGVRDGVDDILKEYVLLEELSFILGDISVSELIEIIHEKRLREYLKVRGFDEEIIKKYEVIGGTTRHSLKQQIHNGPIAEGEIDYEFQGLEYNDLRYGRNIGLNPLTDSQIFRGEEIRDVNPVMTISREEQIALIWGSEVAENEERYELGGEVGSSAHNNLAMHHKKSFEVEYGEPFELIKSSIAIELITTSLSEEYYTFNELYLGVKKSYVSWVDEKRLYIDELKRTSNKQYAGLNDEQKVVAKDYYKETYLELLKWDKILFNSTGIFETIFDYLVHSLKEKKIIELKKRELHDMHANPDNSQDIIVVSKTKTGKISEIGLESSIAFHGADSMLFVN